MLRTFEELGVSIDGVQYGLFSGEAEFDRAGDVVQITLDPVSANAQPLVLDIAKLVSERIGLRRRYGSAFLDAPSSDVRSHVRRYELFTALSDTLDKIFADDVRDFISDAQETSRFDAA